jgi:hypothetical protein
VSHSTKTGPIAPESVPDAERRRIGKVVHDDRGNATVRWLDAPSDYQRPVLELARDSAPARKPEESFNPYAHGATRNTASSTPSTATSTPSTPSTAASTRTDLRKLSEWIKMMRELEERKRNGGDQD